MRLLGIESQPDPTEGRGTFICRHSPGDPDCSSNGGGYVREQHEAAARENDRLKKQVADLTSPKVDEFEMVEVEEVGPHLVVKAKYPNCAKCSYEGNKIMVFLNTPTKDALFWKLVDPHFRDPSKPHKKSEAPGPAARFPASPEGWQDALDYARFKARSSEQ